MSVKMIPWSSTNCQQGAFLPSYRASVKPTSGDNLKLQNVHEATENLASIKQKDESGCGIHEFNHPQNLSSVPCSSSSQLGFPFRRFRSQNPEEYRELSFHSDLTEIGPTRESKSPKINITLDENKNLVEPKEISFPMSPPLKTDEAVMVTSTTTTQFSSAPPEKAPTQTVAHEPLQPVTFSRLDHLKYQLKVDTETLLEFISAIGYAVKGILLGLILLLIPRRFRYKDVSGQIILITGAGSGIGRLLARKFALQHRAIVVAWDINEKGNEETVTSIKAAGGVCYGYKVDVSNRTEVYKTAGLVKTDIGKVDILINNAGIVGGRLFLDTPDEDIIKTFEVNALSNFWTAKAFMPAMLESGKGHLVTIASSAGLYGTNRLVDYCASKYAAVGFDDSIKFEIQNELGYNDFHCTVVCPYFINTGMFDGIRTKLLPVLLPEAVANDVVAAILTNQEKIVIPRYFTILLLIRELVPGKVARRIATAMGITGCMITFKGSHTQSQNTQNVSNGVITPNPN